MLLPMSLIFTLDSMYKETKARAIPMLKARRDAFGHLSFKEAFCSFQLDITTVTSKEYITFSTSLVVHDSGSYGILTLIPWAFHGTHKEADIVGVIKEMRRRDRGICLI